MQSYDQVEGFEYWKVEAWKNFIKESIVPLYASTSKLLKLRDYILSIVGTEGKTTLSEVENRRDDLIPFLLGGVKEDGEYKENSLAKLTRLTLGIYVNPKEWITLEREEGLRAFDYITVKNESTSFLEFLKRLNELSLHIIELVKEKPEVILESEIEEIIQEPEKLLEIVKTIYVKCAQVSVNYSYYTFFALSTRTLPFKYITMAYPKLGVNFDAIRDFLGLKKIFEPMINEVNIKESYTIWGHLKDGLCNLLYNLNDAIWEGFSNEEVNCVFSYISASSRNLKQEYFQKIQQKLEEMKLKFPDYIQTSNKEYYTGESRGYGPYKGVYYHKYLISGSMLVKEMWAGYSTRGNYWSGENKCSISLFKLLDDLSPFLFLTPAIELKITDNELEIIR